MACSSPLYRFNEYTQSLSRVPCGWCMNCRVDRRTYFQDKIEYEYFKNFNGIGTFGCITYDDCHIPLGLFGDKPTLVKSDMQKFWKRVRRYISYHKVNNEFINPNFKHFTVGEYSDGCRPHYHFIAVGLDFQVAQELYRKCWKMADIIDSRPILDGGIPYVLKYIDKQQHGEQLEIYDDEGIEPPFMINSHQVGLGLYDSSNINLEDLTYNWNGKRRPLPAYIKNLLCLPLKPLEENKKIHEFALRNNMSYDDADLFIRIARETFFEHRSTNSLEPVARVKKFNNTNLIKQKRFSCYGQKKLYGSSVFAF